MLDTYLQALAAGSTTAGVVVFFALLIGHSLGDHPLQGEYLALYKNRSNKPGPAINNGDPSSVWVHCLTAHALIHAGIVWAITSSPILGVIELCLHWIIDFIKGENKITLHVDQTLHLLCKVGYVVAIAKGWIALT